MPPDPDHSAELSPYTPPTAPLAGEIAAPTGRSTMLLISNWLLLVLALVFATTAQMIAPDFREMFAAFGADTPLLTRLFVEYTPLCFFVPVLGLILALWVTVVSEHSAPFRSLMGWISVGNLLLVLSLPVVGIIAIFLPIFVMDLPTFTRALGH